MNEGWSRSSGIPYAVFFNLKPGNDSIARLPLAKLAHDWRVGLGPRFAAQFDAKGGRLDNPFAQKE